MSFDKVIALIDMDCFYVQCEQRLAPEYWSHPCAVAQYNSWKGGGLIAVNYEARDLGVKRGIRGNDAIALCPDIKIFSVPEDRGKANLTRYRDASHEVFEAIKQFVSVLNPHIIVEKASVDEAFIDLTQHINDLVDRSEPVPEVDSYIGTKLELDSENDLKKWLDNLRDNELICANDVRLALGAVVVQQIRKEILDKTQFKCSAGISHNKMLAKLVCAVNKPNAQTILPQRGIDQLFQRIDLKKVRYLGGKLGTQVKTVYKINTMYELKCLEYKELCKTFEAKTAKWLKEVADGLDDDPVTNRQTSKSLGCGKNFPGKTALSTQEDVRHWVKQLSEELVERMTKDKEINKRSPKLMVIGFRFNTKDHNSRSLALDSTASANQIADQIMKQLFSRIKLEPIVNLSIAASKFIEECDEPSNNTIKLDQYFRKVDKNDAFVNGMSGSPNKKVKNTHTKTLDDLWKASTSTANTSSADTSAITIERDVQLIEIECEDRSDKRPEHPWNMNAFNQKSIETINNHSKEELNTNYENISTDEPIVIDNIEDNNYNQNSSTHPMFDEKSVKRGFFYRKHIQLRAEERAAEQQRIKERIDVKNGRHTANKQTYLDHFLNSKPKS